MKPLSTSNTDFAAWLSMEPQSTSPDNLEQNADGRVFFIFSTITPEQGKVLYMQFLQSDISNFIDKRRKMGSLVASFKENQ